MNRRRFLFTSAAAFAPLPLASLAPPSLAAQEGQVPQVPMDEGAYRPIRRDPKPGAVPVVDDAARDVLEHRLRCMCGCTLGVYTCRTTDFTCPVSPAMHRDINALIAGGYTADEILEAFIDRYGEQILMAPRAQGFNISGYVMPFVALAAGVTVATLLLRRWTRQARVAAADGVVETPVAVDATPDELARLQAAVRDDYEDDDE